jgi:hypothetical protein
MPIKITVTAPGNVMLELECADNKDVFKQLSFWSKLPHECPVDGMPTALGHRKTASDEDYYEIVSTGPIPWRMSIGQHKVGGGLFVKADNGWGYWDGQREVTAPRTKGGDAQSPRPKAEVAESASPKDVPPRPDELEWDYERDGLEYGADGWPNITSQQDAFLAAIVDKARTMGVTFNMVVNSDVGKQLGVKQVSELFQNPDQDFMKSFYKTMFVVGKRAAEAGS